MTITVVGHGYVGLVTACVFADLGNTVYVIGHSLEKLKRLREGDPIIFEPGLTELLQKNLEAKRLIITYTYEKAIPASEVVFIAVGTPSQKSGEADLTSVLQVAESIGKNLSDHYTVVSCKSTVPVGTNKKIHVILENKAHKQAQFDVASCPEFLSQGTAIQNTFSPDRIVIGSNSQKALATLLTLHEPLNGKRVIVSLESAEIIKYASNALLATKISFANLVSFLCERTGADVEEVLDGVGLDTRIGRVFLYPGVGYGGSCFPKDVRALTHTSIDMGIDMTLLEAVDRINIYAKDNFIQKILIHSPGKKLAIWGLAFKPNTDDIREAPAVYIIQKLLDAGYDLYTYDPEANKNTQNIFGDRIVYTTSPYDAVDGSDALVILTEWNEFKQIDLKKIKKLLKNPVIFDGRNIYDPITMKKLGFSYYSVGR